MTVCAAGVLRILVMCWTSGFISADTVVNTMAGQTQLIHGTESQQPGVSGTMRRMTNRTTLCLEWGVFVDEWTLFIGMTLNTCRICSNS